jgi:hypothetical protein
MTLLRFVVAVFYSLVGVSGGIAFMILKNYPAAILAVTTGILNIMLSYIHFLNYKNKLQDLYSPPHLRQIGTFGFFSFAISTSILIYFTVIEIMEKKRMKLLHTLKFNFLNRYNFQQSCQFMTAPLFP